MEERIPYALLHSRGERLVKQTLKDHEKTPNTLMIARDCPSLPATVSRDLLCSLMLAAQRSDDPLQTLFGLISDRANLLVADDA